MFVKIVEHFPHDGHQIAFGRGRLQLGTVQNIQLNVKKFFKFQPFLCQFERLRIFWKMDIEYALRQIEQVVFLQMLMQKQA